MDQHFSAAIRVTRLPLGDRDVFLAEGLCADQAAALCLAKARAAGWKPPSVLRFWEFWRWLDDRKPRDQVWVAPSGTATTKVPASLAQAPASSQQRHPEAIPS